MDSCRHVPIRAFFPVAGTSSGWADYIAQLVLYEPKSKPTPLSPAVTAGIRAKDSPSLSPAHPAWANRVRDRSLLIATSRVGHKGVVGPRRGGASPIFVFQIYGVAERCVVVDKVPRAGHVDSNPNI
jgi:hypothetical protein